LTSRYRVFPFINPDELRETLHSKLVTIPRQLDITRTLQSQTPRIQPTFLIALLPISNYQSTFHKHPEPYFFLTCITCTRYEDAERDCTSVLSLSKKNVKAYFRRAQARVALQKLGEAHNGACLTHLRLDILRVYLVSCRSTVGTQNRAEERRGQGRTRACRRAHLEQEGKDSTFPGSYFSPTSQQVQRTVPVDVPAPPLASSTSSTTAPPKRRRVPITIVDSDAPTNAEPTNDLLKPISSRLLSTSPDPKPAAAAEPGPTPKPEPASFKEAKQVRDEKKAGRVGGGIFRVSGNDTFFKTREVPAPKDPAHPPVPLSATRGSASASASSVRPSPPTTRPALVPPRTLFEFTRSWDGIPATDTASRWSLLNVRPPRLLLHKKPDARRPSLLRPSRPSSVPRSNRRSSHRLSPYLQKPLRPRKLATFYVRWRGYRGSRRSYGFLARRNAARRVLCGKLSSVTHRMQMRPRLHVHGASQNINTPFRGDVKIKWHITLQSRATTFFYII
jgi:hypothetical protein